MYRTTILKEFIKEKVDEYLDNSWSITNFTTDFKKMIESPDFQNFRQNLLFDILYTIRNREANTPDDEDETLTIQTQMSLIADLEDNRPKPLLSKLGSSISTTITQDLDFFNLNGNHLTEMAHLLDPRVSSTSKRREILKQIIGMPPIETQICDAWGSCLATPTPERPFTDESNRWSTSKRSLDGTSSLYGIRQGLLDALDDDDIELNLLSLKFISKAFSSSSGNVKECYFLLADYLEGQFKFNKDRIPFISNGLDINNPEIARIIRAFHLLHEFHTKLPTYWLRYSEKLTESLMDRCLSLLSVVYSPVVEMTSADNGDRITPLHVISIFDPKAHWFSLWMRGAYGCRPMLKRLVKTKQIISMWVASCVNVFLNKPEHSRKTKRTDSCSSQHIKSAYFLHSLHVLTILLCFKESHTKIFPVNISKNTISSISCEDRITLVKGGALPVKIFMRLFIGFILSLNGEENTGENSLLNLVDKCLQRLAISPVANMPCFGLSMDNSLPSISRKNKKSSVYPIAFDKSDASVVQLILTEIRLAVNKPSATGGVNKGYRISTNICILTKALVNICSTVQGEEYFTHYRNARQKQSIIQILTSCLEFIFSEKLEIFCKVDTKSVLNVTEIMDHMLIVFSRTHLSIKRMYSQTTIDFLHWVLDTMHSAKNQRKDMRQIDENILKRIDQSMNNFLMSLLKCPIGLELVESSGCLRHLLPKFLCSNEFIVSAKDFELLVTKLSSSLRGFKLLNQNGLIDARFEEAWKLLEGSGIHSIVDGDQGQVVNYHLKDSLDVERGFDNSTLIPVDPNDDQTFNRLISIFANVASVTEALNSPVSRVKSTEGLQVAPRNLSDFIDRVIMLDSATKLAKLCRPDETSVFGLKFLSAITSSLNIFLLLESRFGIRSMLINGQLRSRMDVEGGISGKFMIDEGAIERNRLLVKCSVIGGPNERHLPSRCLCEHGANPYPYPIITSLSADSFEPFFNQSKQYCNQSPCIDSPVSHPVTSKRPISKSFVNIVLSSLKSPSGPRVKPDHDILHKLPNIKMRITSLTKHLKQSNKQIPDIGCLFDICLRTNRGVKQSVSPTVQLSSASSTLQAREEIAISMIVEYGRRIKALDSTVSENIQINALADLLLHGKTSTPSNKLLGKKFEKNDSGQKSKQDEIFQIFDWFAALIFLIFNGDGSRTCEFLRAFREAKRASFLWNSLVSLSTPQQYTICHAFETILACELPQVYNTFVLSGYSPSVIFRCWMHQCFLNYLDWPEIQDFFLICLLCGPEFIIYFAVAIMAHLSPLLRRSLQSQCHLVTILEKPITDFRLVENLEVMESLAARYGEQLSCKLASLTSAE